MKRFFLITVLMALGFYATAQYTPHWTPMTGLESNMNVMGSVVVNGVQLESEAYEIGAFCGAECRGSAFLSDMAGIYMALQTIGGSSGEEITFRVYDHIAGEEVVADCNTTLSFVADAFYGSPTEPYVISFTPPTYTVTTQVNPTGAGVVTGGGNFAAGENCTLSFTTNPGYTFSGWTIDGSIVGTDDTYSFTVSDNVTVVANYSAVVYTIYGYCDPVSAGSITTSGASEGTNGFYLGDNCTFTATANPGFLFEKWTSDDAPGVTLSTNPVYSFEVTEATALRNYFAHFTVATNTYEIAVSCDPAGAGTVTGAGTYAEGAPCTLTATASPGSSFQGWKLGGSLVSTDNPYTFTVTEDAEYVAAFDVTVFMVTASANPSHAGSVTGAAGYTYDQVCTLEATANEGWVFQDWSLYGTSVSTDNPYVFNVTESADYVANFTEGYVVNVTMVDGTGTVTGLSDNNTYAPGSSLTITVLPDLGCTFQFFAIGGNYYEGTYDAMTGTYSYTLTVDGNMDVELLFSTEIYTITVSANPTQGGTVVGGGGFHYGETCSIAAVANEGYVFTGWTLNGTLVSTENPYTILSVTESADFVANFVVGVQVVVIVDPEFGGTVDGAGIYVSGDNCTLTFTPANEHYTFEGWVVDGEIVSTDNPYTFTVTDNITLTVALSYDTYIISATPNLSIAGEAVVETGSGPYVYGEPCTISATPNVGYIFTQWTLNGAVVSTENPYTFNVTESADFVAEFVEGVAYTVTTMANPAEGGTTTGDNIFNPGDMCTVTATANGGYTFINWTHNGVVVSTDTEYTFPVNDNMTLVANFSQDLYYVSVDYTEGGHVNGLYPGGYFLYGHWCIIEAVPHDGYTFSHWTMDGMTVDSLNHILRFMVTADTDVVAHFAQDGYYISATTNPYGAGTITGEGNYTYGQNCTLDVTANPGYTFLNWTKNGEVVATTTSCTFTVEGDANYVANFEQNTYSITVEANPANAAFVFVQNAQNGQFVYGQECTLRVATPNAGYTFLYWSLNNNIVSMEPNYTFTVTDNAHFVAVFAVNQYQIDATAVPSVGGTVDGAGVYEHGSVCTLTATARPGYTFLRWTKNGVTVSTDANYTFTVTSAAAYVAQFTSRAVSISAEIGVRGMGEIYGTGYYEVGDKVTLQVVPGDDYIFVNWTLNGEVVSTEAEYTFLAETDAHFVANVMYFTDVNENGSINVSVYPNPVVNELNVLTDQAEYQLDIFTITGALVRTMSNCSNTTRVEVQDLPAGTYIIRLTNGNTVESRRFVKE